MKNLSLCKKKFNWLIFLISYIGSNKKWQHIHPCHICTLWEKSNKLGQISLSKNVTRKHSSRMRTTHLPTVRISVATTICQQGREVRSSSEQVWTGLQWWSPDVSSRVEGKGGRSQGLVSEMRGRGRERRGKGGGVGPQVWCLEWGGGRVFLPCDLSHDACDAPTPVCLQTDRCLWKHYLPSILIAGVKDQCKTLKPLNTHSSLF